MFGSLFGSDAFQHLHISPAFSHANYNVPNPSRIPLPSHLSRGRHAGHAPPHHQHYQHHQRQHRLRRGYSFFSDLSPASSDQDLTDDIYHHPSDSDSSAPLPHMDYIHARHKEGNHNHNQNILSPFHHTTVKLAHQAFANLPATHTATSVLILPCTLTPLHIRISTPSATHTLHATVAGDMRFHDVVRQLVQPIPFSEVRACVRLRGEWQQPASNCRMSEVMEQGGRYLLNERGEVEVRIEVAGGGTRNGHAGARRRFRAWGRETGRAWEIKE